MAIAALVLWLLTAGAGIWLLRSGKAAGRRPGAAAPAETLAAGPGQTLPTGPAPTPAAAANAAPAGMTPAARAAVTADAGAPPGMPATGVAGAPAIVAAPPRTPDGRPPPVPRTRVVSPPGEHPLREFAHPALAITGLACWLGFVLIHNRAMAWAALGVLAVALGAGLGWLAGSRRAARRHPGTARVFPPRLIALHGAAATTVVALTLLSALSAAGRS